MSVRAAAGHKLEAGSVPTMKVSRLGCLGGLPCPVLKGSVMRQAVATEEGTKSIIVRLQHCVKLDGVLCV